jgi:hypothetical protein
VALFPSQDLVDPTAVEVCSLGDLSQRQASRSRSLETLPPALATLLNLGLQALKPCLSTANIR